MDDKKVTDAACTLLTSFQEANGIVAEHLMAAQERSVMFIPSSVTICSLSLAVNNEKKMFCHTELVPSLHLSFYSAYKGEK